MLWAERQCPWGCNPDNPARAHDWNATSECGSLIEVCKLRRSWQYAHGPTRARAAMQAACPAASPLRLPPPQSRSRATVCNGEASIGSNGLVLLIGISSAPANAARRTAIRETWMRWQSHGDGSGGGVAVAACFAVGRGGVERLPSSGSSRRAIASAAAAAAATVATADEASRQGDSLLLWLGWPLIST